TPAFVEPHPGRAQHDRAGSGYRPPPLELTARPGARPSRCPNEKGRPRRTALRLVAGAAGSVARGLKVHRREFAAVVDLDVKGNAVALFEARHAGALHRADVDKGVRLPIVARNEAEALRRVEEFDCARSALAGQLTPAARTAGAILALTRREVLDR